MHTWPTRELSNCVLLWLLLLHECGSCALMNLPPPRWPAEKRQAEAARIRDKYPDRIPVRTIACCL